MTLTLTNPDDTVLVVPPQFADLAAFRTWAHSDAVPERCRVTYIAGELFIDMSKERIDSHVKVKTEVSRVLANLSREFDLGELYGDGAMISNEAADVSNVPAAMFVSWNTIASGRVEFVTPERGLPDGLEVLGTPDCVLEVVSRNSVRKDMILLLEAYHRAGITEYWLVDARRERLAFTIYHHAPDAYEPAPRSNGWQLSNVFAREFRFVRSVGRLDRIGYTLHHRTPKVRD